MSIRKTVLPVLDFAYRLLGPSGPIDIRPTSVTVVQQRWPGGRIGVGGPPVVLSSLKLPDGTGVKQVSERDVAQSGGRYEVGDVIVGPVVPSYDASALGPAGGFSEDQLDPPVDEMGTENVYRLALQSGASGIAGDYQLKDFRRDSSFGYQLVVRRKVDTP